MSARLSTPSAKQPTTHAIKGKVYFPKPGTTPDDVEDAIA